MLMKSLIIFEILILENRSEFADYLVTSSYEKTFFGNCCHDTDRLDGGFCCQLLFFLEKRKKERKEKHKKKA